MEVVPVLAESVAVVGGQHDEGVLRELEVVEAVDQAPDLGQGVAHLGTVEPASGFVLALRERVGEDHPAPTNRRLADEVDEGSTVFRRPLFSCELRGWEVGPVRFEVVGVHEERSACRLDLLDHAVREPSGARLSVERADAASDQLIECDDPPYVAKSAVGSLDLVVAVESLEALGEATSAREPSVVDESRRVEAAIAQELGEGLAIVG